MQAWGGDGRADGMWFEEVGLPSMSKTTSDSALLHPHCYYQHWKANKDWGWEILSLFSPNLVANQTPISSITPPPHAILGSTAYTSPLAARRGSSDPESDTPSPSRILSPVCRNSRSPRCFLYAGIQVAESSSPPPSE